MSSIPKRPPADGEGRGPIAVRYEDVAEDGRMIVDALATGVNDTMWRIALQGSPLVTHAFPSGLLAILTRFVVEGTDGPFDVDGTFEAEASYTLAHGVDAVGSVQRLYLNAWVDTYAPIGRTNLPPPPDAGRRALVGRAFAEHVFTRPFAPPAERKVLRFDIPGLPEVPPCRYDALAPDAALDLPEGATVLDESPFLDPTTIAFGLRHTDSNQHVNSLAYPRLFEDACLRRFSGLGRETRVLARSLDVTYRKPSFAGQSMRIALRAFERDGRLGASGAFYDSGELDRLGLAAARPHVYVKLTF